MSKFDTALHEVFQGRETGFSNSLRDLLRQLYDRGGEDSSTPAAGTEVGRFEELSLGVCFSNSYLRNRDQYRVVTGVNRHSDGRVESVTTQLVRSDGTILQQHDIFDRGKFQTYGPYTHGAA